MVWKLLFTLNKVRLLTFIRSHNCLVHITTNLEDCIKICDQSSN